MLISIVLILLMGFFAGQIARRLHIPPLVGMILVGICLGPQLGNIISANVLNAADDLRVMAVTVILMKAGLGLDWEKLAQQGTVAIRLGVIPGITEAVIVAVISMMIFHFDFLTGLLMGCIIGGESPAVIVPGMLQLKNQGWGVAKGIPDAILTGSALPSSLLIFGLLLDFLSGKGIKTISFAGITITSVQFLPIEILLQIGLGIIFGYLVARSLVSLLSQQNWTQNAVQDSLVTSVVALFLAIIPKFFPYFSGYLAVMAMGFFLVKLDAPLARRLRRGFDSLWVVAEIFLFVLMGASIQFQVLQKIFFPGIVLLVISVLVGRTFGAYISTLGSNWNWSEKLFLVPAYSAKATVQAAIGALPLAEGIKGGEIILAMAALAILTTAPLGAWAIPTFAPKLLEKGEIDPTKVSVVTPVKLLAAVDDSWLATEVLKKAADLARRSDGEVIILHVVNVSDDRTVEDLKEQIKRILPDVRHKLITVSGSVPEEIVQVAQDYKVTDIVMGKRGNGLSNLFIGSVSQAVLESSPIPVILVEDNAPKSTN